MRRPLSPHLGRCRRGGGSFAIQITRESANPKPEAPRARFHLHTMLLIALPAKAGREE
jgi:hypothetical protein